MQFGAPPVSPQAHSCIACVRHLLLNFQNPGMDEAAGMLALHAAVKAELGEDGLPAGGGAALAAPAEAARPPNTHGRLKFLQEYVPVKAEVKIEFGLVDEVNVEIKSEARRTDSTRAAVSRPVGAAVHDLTGGVADAGGWRRVQPTRGAKRRAVAYAAQG